jgi:hypothetical protein
MDVSGLYKRRHQKIRAQVEGLSHIGVIKGTRIMSTDWELSGWSYILMKGEVLSGFAHAAN